MARPGLALAKRAIARRRVAAPVAGHAERAPVVAARPVGYAPHRLRVLVVDDRALVGEQVARMLAGHDVTTVTSADGATAAVRRAGDRAYDAILYSIGMPRLSGFAFANLLASLQPGLRARLVFLLDQAPSAALLRNVERTGVRWITKPLRYAPLAMAVDFRATAPRHAAVREVPALASAA